MGLGLFWTEGNEGSEGGGGVDGVVVFGKGDWEGEGGEGWGWMKGL